MRGVAAEKDRSQWELVCGQFSVKMFQDRTSFNAQESHISESVVVRRDLQKITNASTSRAS